MVIERQRLLSVQEAAAQLHASDAYVRRLLGRQRLNGIKVGVVWAIYESDLEAFARLRRPPGRPRKALEKTSQERDMRRHITAERKDAGTGRLLRKRRRRRNQR